MLAQDDDDEPELQHRRDAVADGDGGAGEAQAVEQPEDEEALVGHQVGPRHGAGLRHMPFVPGLHRDGGAPDRRDGEAGAFPPAG